MRALLLRKGKKQVDRRAGREEEGICRTNVKVLPTPLCRLRSAEQYTETTPRSTCLILDSSGRSSCDGEPGDTCRSVSATCRP